LVPFDFCTLFQACSNRSPYASVICVLWTAQAERTFYVAPVALLHS